MFAGAIGPLCGLESSASERDERETGHIRRRAAILSSLGGSLHIWTRATGGELLGDAGRAVDFGLMYATYQKCRERCAECSRVRLRVGGMFAIVAARGDMPFLNSGQWDYALSGLSVLDGHDSGVVVRTLRKKGMPSMRAVWRRRPTRLRR